MYIYKAPERVSLKGYVRDDCTINAIGNTLGLSYDLARKVLQTINFSDDGVTFRKKSPRTKYEFAVKSNVERVCSGLSVRQEDHKAASQINGQRNKEMSLKDFTIKYPVGVFIVLVERHLVAVINGKIIDTWDSSKLIVEKSYMIDINKGRDLIKDIAKFYRMTSNKHIIENHIDIISR